MELLRCHNPKCGVPLAKQEGGKLFILRNQGGKTMTVNIEVPYDGGGYYKVQCGNCGRSKHFLLLAEKLKLKAKVDHPRTLNFMAAIK